MAVPTLTWSQGAYTPIPGITASDVLGVLFTLYGSDAYWEVSATDNPGPGSTYLTPSSWLEIKPKSGSNVPNARILFMMGTAPHADKLVTLGTLPSSATVLYVALAPDAGTTGPDDTSFATAGSLYLSRTTEFINFFDFSGTASDRIYINSSDEITVLFLSRIAGSNEAQAICVGSIIEANADDAESDGRIWGYARSYTAPVGWSSTWMNGTGTTTGWFRYSLGLTVYQNFGIFTPWSPSNLMTVQGDISSPLTGSRTSFSGRTKNSEISVYENSAPNRHIGVLRQIYVTEKTVTRTEVQDADTSATLGYTWSPELTSSTYDTLFFGNS